MTDLTTRPAAVGTPEPAPAAKPVNGVAVADRRTLRHITRAEQERLSADAEVERRARAAQLDLDLREQRRAAARREREADAADKRARADARRTRRAARRARLVTATPRWADRALFVLPIMFPMAVAWVGQIRFAMTVMGWPLPAAIVFAAGFELSTAYVARLDWLSRAAGDSALLFRGATWGFAAGAATMNYWHAAGPGFTPTGEAVSYGLMSITGVVLWELLSTYRHRTALRAEGKLPAARPGFGLARWVWFGRLTRVAWLLTLRDGYTTTNLAWRAAIGAVALYGSPKQARNAVRAGRPVPRPELLDDDRDDPDGTIDNRGCGHDGHQRDVETQREDRTNTGPGRDEQRDTETRHNDRDDPERPERTGDPAPAGHIANTSDGPTTSEPDVRAYPDLAVTDPSNDQVGRPPDQSATNTTVGNEVEQRNGHGSATGHHAADDEHSPTETGDCGDPPAQLDPDETRLDAVEANVGARMLAFARARLAEGAHVTGAELDRQFGTRDYGRRILRRLATESQTVGGQRPA
jgi:hypothetical protein